MGDFSTTSDTILITGASGQYGRLAVDKLLSMQIPPTRLILVTRDTSKLTEYALRGVSLRQGSFDDPVDTLAEAFSGANTMLFIATARAGKRLPQHRAAVDAAIRAGLSHIVYTSIVSAQLEHPTALVAQEHRATELMLQSSGLAWTALRDSQYAEAMTDVAAGPAIEARRLRSNAGDGRIAFISRNDCVAAAVAVLANPMPHRNKAYDITGPELLSWHDVANIISTVTGISIEYEYLNDDEQLAVFDQMGIPREPIDDVVTGGYPWNSSDMVSFTKATRLGEMSNLSDDVQALTGTRPKALQDVFRDRMMK